jgi:hypothetical protein
MISDDDLHEAEKKMFKHSGIPLEDIIFRDVPIDD